MALAKKNGKLKGKQPKLPQPTRDRLLRHPDLLSLSANFWSEQIQETRQRLSVTRQKAAVLMENMRVLRDQLRTLVGVHVPVQSQVRLDVHSDDRRSRASRGHGPGGHTARLHDPRAEAPTRRSAVSGPSAAGVVREVAGQGTWSAGQWHAINPL
ncbi:hypothetical protein ACIBI9_66260 [Nonomuraea sp. NPDC050451]|uniref:hypothetical protein n=1 Tax=Nonomuraea sp. NPDC050451 TaxID=3364364 RepID=UPI0037A21364